MAQNFQVTPDGQNYANKMNQVLKEHITKWWQSLNKEELLTYLLEQPSITADMIRNMLSNEQCVMNFEVNFAIADGDATANFHTTED